MIRILGDVPLALFTIEHLPTFGAQDFSIRLGSYFNQFRDKLVPLVGVSLNHLSFLYLIIYKNNNLSILKHTKIYITI
jgi:hypothetical protein